MLRFLSIRNLAVIDRLELEFEPGLNVLTGETGAGKSILVGAVGLLVGGRASAELVRTGEETAAVEAVFDRPGGSEVLLRREISASGRSRAFVDGALATSGALRELSGLLVDLHGQHEHQVLLDPSTHTDLLDAFAGGTTERAAVAAAYAAWHELTTERARRLTSARENAARAEFLAYQLAEIDRVAPVAGEDEELGASRQVLANADRLQRLCTEAYDALYDGDAAALPALAIVWKRLADLSAIDPRFTPHLDARDVVKSQLDELAFFLRSYAGGIDASPERLQEVEDRLALLERLKKKHGPTLAEVLDKAGRLRRDLADLEHGAERGAEIDTAVAASRDRYLATAKILTARRTKAATTFASALEKSLGDLAMARTRCDVRFTPAASEAEWGGHGVERAELFISPNPGEDLRPLAKIVSGGELSRIMLALKTLASTDAPGKTLIFDEVDAGIGGAVADVVGGRLQRLAEQFQVLCITHLPQIAAHGATHFHIAKTVRQGRTQTSVARLGAAGREEELARMIAGNVVSTAVRASASEMLRARRAGAKGEIKTKAKGESER
ncbi:MAG: DNA repair protein RecN [Vicinamibacterales bacterium]